MKILITSLQVSLGASKGHLHPAIEVGLELKRRGHVVGILPLPSAFNREDREQIRRCEFEIIDPPELPEGLPLPPHKLAHLAKNPLTTAQAYQSFLVDPLNFQFKNILKIYTDFSPDIILYDLLVYAAPLAARKLGIPDIGYCAGLKLIAPSQLTQIYRNIYQQLQPSIDLFLSQQRVHAHFHGLELLASTYQLVFTPAEFINVNILPRNTKCVGSLPISASRCEYNQYYINKKYGVVCFGSVLDPADYPELMQSILKVAQDFNLHLMITSKKLSYTTDNVTIAPYLPIPQLLTHAAIFIHHGGANTFSESLTLGAPQILIPLTTDQPIQAEYLRQVRAGFVIYPTELTEEKLHDAFTQLLDKKNLVHQRIQEMRNLFQQSTGAARAADLIEEVNGSREQVAG